jgi:glycosyltransferase involved in cell wall biosynthesis
LEDGDYLHEYDFPPKPFPEKDIDLFCVSRLIDLKNIPFIAKALKVYRQKYPQKPVRLTLITGREFDQNFQGILPYEVREWRQVESILIHPQDYIELIPRVDWYRTLPLMYARAKVYLFGSLIEGKNRSMAEALCCNTPILYNIEFNQYIRGETPIVPEGAGLGAFYDPESWADTLHLMLNNLGEFTPRKQFLKYRGRKNFLNTAIDSVSYYRQHLPNYQEGKHHQNTWLDTAVGYHYNLSLMEFLYGKRHGISQVRGITQIRQAMEVYRAAVGKR